MPKEYYTIRIEKELKTKLELLKHKISIKENTNKSLSETIEYIIEEYEKR